MSRLVAAALVFAASAALAADDLTVLKPGPNDTPPRKLLHEYLLKECRTQLAARKEAVEKLKTPAEVAARQADLKAKFVAALGGFPEKTPLNAKTVGVLKRDGYRIEKLVYESRPNHHVTANLYVPDGPGPFPGVLMPIGHSQNGKAADYVQRGCVLLAKNGFVALTYDPIGQGERVQLLDPLGNPAIKGSTSEHTMVGVGALLVGRCTASYRVWDGIRSLDYLCSRPEVDPKRLGCTGCSGGGTDTSYFMALDDRIAAAAPSCYITSLERLFSTIGPQDAEQNIPGQVAFGMDHADYLLMRAPKPTLICAATRDFFDIQGTWDTFREAKRVYGKLGYPERVELVESDTPHGYPRPHREAVVRFFSRWLRGVDAAVTEPDFPIEKDADLQCTRSGQVLEDFKGVSAFDLNAKEADALARTRAGTKQLTVGFQHDVRKLIGLTDWDRKPTVGAADLLPRPGFFAKKLAVQPRSAVPLPALTLFHEPNPTDLPVVIFHDQGLATALPLAEKLAMKREVIAVDLRGMGETAPGTGKPGPFGHEFKESFLSMHLSRPLIGQRVADVLTALHVHSQLTAVEVIGVGAAAPVVLHAAALDDRIKSVTLDGCVLSWDHVARTPVSHNQLATVVHGALAVYDLPDLAAAVAPRKLTIRNPLDAAGRPATPELIEATYRPARAAYEKANAADQFVIEK